MEERPDWLESGPERPPLWQRLPPGVRRRLMVAAVFALGVAVGGYAVAALSPAPAQDTATSQPQTEAQDPPAPAATTEATATTPKLTASLLRINRDGPTQALFVSLQVTNHGSAPVRIRRLVAEGLGWAVRHTSPRPPPVGGPLRVAPGGTGAVGVAVVPVCLRTREIPHLTFLVVLGNGIGPGRTVALPTEQANATLRERRIDLCQDRNQEAAVP